MGQHVKIALLDQVSLHPPITFNHVAGVSIKGMGVMTGVLCVPEPQQESFAWRTMQTSLNLAHSKTAGEYILYGGRETVSNFENKVVVISLGSSEIHPIKPKNPL
jgi:hypothetical protein